MSRGRGRAVPCALPPWPFWTIVPIGLFPSFTFLSRTLWTIDCFLAIISGSPSQFTNPALPSWKNIQGAPVASCKRLLSHGEYLESHPHTRKARPADRLRELTFTPNHLHSAQPDAAPHAEICRTLLPQTGATWVTWAAPTPLKDSHTSPCSSPWASFRPPGLQTGPGKKELSNETSWILTDYS